MEAGAIGGIVVDNLGDISKSSPLFAMSGDGNDDVNIPVVFLFEKDAAKLLLALTKDLQMKVTLGYRKSSPGKSLLTSLSFIIHVYIVFLEL